MNPRDYKNELMQIIMTEYQMQFPLHKNLSTKDIRHEQIVMFLFMALRRSKGKPMQIAEFKFNAEQN